MIESITIINPKNESLVLTLSRPWETGLYIKNIEGLGPPKAQINNTDLATIDGSIFSSARLTERNIIFTIGLLFNPTVEDSRLKTYRYFPIKKPITMRFKTTNRNVEITGVVESNEPDIFSSEETVQISILCSDPYFYNFSEEEETVFSGVRPLFEFPFSNESHTENLIEFGEILLDTRAILTYNGEIDTGVIITIHALGVAKHITLYNFETHESMYIDTDRIGLITGFPYSTGDDIIISTIRGVRYARLLRNGEYTNILSALDKHADWFQITQGDNVFGFSAIEGEKNLMVGFRRRSAYGGI